MLENKIAIVTGASGGIGAATAKRLAADGATVVIHYHSNQEKAECVKKEIEEQGGKAMIYACDISNFTECQDMMKSVKEQFGSIDILVNNAGMNKDGLLSAMKEEAFDQVIATNLKGCFNGIRSVARIMMKQKSGKIINVSSVSGIVGNLGQANYAASKAGMIGLTKSAARELAMRNVNVNAVAPGFIDTDMTKVLSDSIKDTAVEQIPLKRFGKPEEIANTIAFLASDQSDYITGQVLVVDGGLAM